VPAVDASRPKVKAETIVNRKKTMGFGRRGREQAEATAPKVTAVQRLRKLGVQWLQATGLQKKRKAHGTKSAFRSSRQRP
jgi:hypothetical protein